MLINGEQLFVIPKPQIEDNLMRTIKVNLFIVRIYEHISFFDFDEEYEEL